MLQVGAEGTVRFIVQRFYVMSVSEKKFSSIVVLVCVLLFTFLGMGCQKQEETVHVKETYPKRFLIGLIPEQNIFSQKKRYEPLAAYLSEKTGLKIELEMLSRYGNIIDNFTELGLDGAFFGSFTGALAIKKLAIEPLARPEWEDGSSTYYGMVFVRKDSGIRNANDMQGKRFAFVDKATTAGWLLPIHYLNSNGIQDYRSFLQEVYFTGTHEGAIYDVLDRKADIGAAKNTVFYRLARKNPRISAELLILARSPEVPANGLCVKKDLDPALKTKLQESLLNMDQDIEGLKVLKEFGARRFIATAAADYAPVFEYAEHIGLDLATYDYLND
jgi:phosphonate transport system substrate-binding protein